MFESKGFVSHIHRKLTPYLRIDDMKQWDKSEKSEEKDSEEWNEKNKIFMVQ